VASQKSRYSLYLAGIFVFLIGNIGKRATTGTHGVVGVPGYRPEIPFFRQTRSNCFASNKKINMHDLQLIKQIHKDLLLEFMHEAAFENEALPH
jgi:hypothetical protein